MKVGQLVGFRYGLDRRIGFGMLESVDFAADRAVIWRDGKRYVRSVRFIFNRKAAQARQRRQLKRRHSHRPG